MYLKDKKTRITLRLTPKQFVYVKHNAVSLGISPSDFLRQIINVAITQLEREGRGLDWDKLQQEYAKDIERAQNVQ